MKLAPYRDEREGGFHPHPFDKLRTGFNLPPSRGKRSVVFMVMHGGEGGIRTREAGCPAYALSRRAHSSTLAPLQILEDTTMPREGIGHKVCRDLEFSVNRKDGGCRWDVQKDLVGEMKNNCMGLDGGEGGIRTRDTRKRIPLFESGAFVHSATSPGRRSLTLTFHYI